MKNLQELYTETLASNQLKHTFIEAARDGGIADFLKDQDCGATEEEFLDFLKAKVETELPDEELDEAAGGTCSDKAPREVGVSFVIIGVACAMPGDPPHGEGP